MLTRLLIVREKECTLLNRHLSAMYRRETRREKLNSNIFKGPNRTPSLVTDTQLYDGRYGLIVDAAKGITTLSLGLTRYPNIMSSSSVIPVVMFDDRRGNKTEFDQKPVIDVQETLNFVVSRFQTNIRNTLSKRKNFVAQPNGLPIESHSRKIMNIPIVGRSPKIVVKSMKDFFAYLRDELKVDVKTHGKKTTFALSGNSPFEFVDGPALWEKFFSSKWDNVERSMYELLTYLGLKSQISESAVNLKICVMPRPLALPVYEIASSSSSAEERKPPVFSAQFDEERCMTIVKFADHRKTDCTYQEAISDLRALFDSSYSVTEEVDMLNVFRKLCVNAESSEMQAKLSEKEK